LSRVREKPTFAACVARGMTWAAAARLCNVNRQTAYNWLKDDPEFAAMIADAHQQRREFAESKLYQMVDEGIVPAVMFALKHWWPEKYDPKTRVAIGGDPENPLNIGHEHTLSRPRVIVLPHNGREPLTPEQIHQEREAIARESLLAAFPSGPQADTIIEAVAEVVDPDDVIEPDTEPEQCRTITVKRQRA
jgi:hypothetical protein